MFFGCNEYLTQQLNCEQEKENECNSRNGSGGNKPVADKIRWHFIFNEHLIPAEAIYLKRKRRSRVIVRCARSHPINYRNYFTSLSCVTKGDARAKHRENQNKKSKNASRRNSSKENENRTSRIRFQLKSFCAKYSDTHAQRQT